MPEPEIILASAIEAELLAIWAFIAEDNAEAAGRFVEAVYETFMFLAENAKVGEPRAFHAPKLKGVRSWPVSRFRNYLIFYPPPSGRVFKFFMCVTGHGMSRDCLNDGRPPGCRGDATIFYLIRWSVFNWDGLQRVKSSRWFERLSNYQIPL